MGTPSARLELNNAVAQYTTQLAELETRAGQVDNAQLFADLERSTAVLLDACMVFEKTADASELREARAAFHQETAPWFVQSAGMAHTRTWPRGYQGDYRVLEWIYEGLPQSESAFGGLLDSFLLSRKMAIAARGRKTQLCDMLLRELRSRDTAMRILSIACGSCRDIFDVAGEIQRTKSHVTCVDHDSEALAYARRLLLASGIPFDQITFDQMNALRLVSLREALRRFGEQDIVYSVGFLDYLDDDRVGRLLSTWYQLVRPGGSLIVAMKDVTRFEPYTYRWLIDWTGFRGRREEEMAGLFDTAGIPAELRTAVRDPSGVVVLWHVTRR
jgi:SAM-dependent methyltransferase